MNQNCRIYALPSLCYSTLPICRTPERTNHLYFANKAIQKDKQRFKLSTKIPTNYHHHNFNYTSINLRNKRFLDQYNNKDKRLFLLKKKPLISYDDVFSTDNIPNEYPPTRDTENLKRICRDECELLENELCQKEYAIAKRHPTIGQKLPLEDCHNVPNDKDCSSFGIAIDVSPDENCYWEQGSGYRGTVAVSWSGKKCIKWSWLMKEIADFPELAGQNYCR